MAAPVHRLPNDPLHLGRTLFSSFLFPFFFSRNPGGGRDKGGGGKGTPREGAGNPGGGRKPLFPLFFSFFAWTQAGAGTRRGKDPGGGLGGLADDFFSLFLFFFSLFIMLAGRMEKIGSERKLVDLWPPGDGSIFSFPTKNQNFFIPLFLSSLIPGGKHKGS